VAERKILQLRYLTYGWFFYKEHLPHPKNDKKIGPKCKFHRSAASAKTIRSITITFLVSNLILNKTLVYFSVKKSIV
jgi:hypothetical protein